MSYTRFLWYKLFCLELVSFLYSSFKERQAWENIQSDRHFDNFSWQLTCDPFHKLRFPTLGESLTSIQKSVQIDTGTTSADIREVPSYTRAQWVQTISLTCLCKVDSAAVSPVKLDNIKIYIYWASGCFSSLHDIAASVLLCVDVSLQMWSVSPD